MPADLRFLPEERARRLPGGAPLQRPVPTRQREILRRLFVLTAEDLEGVDVRGDHDDDEAEDFVIDYDAGDDDDDDTADDDDDEGGKGSSPRSA